MTGPTSVLPNIPSRRDPQSKRDGEPSTAVLSIAMSVLAAGLFGLVLFTEDANIATVDNSILVVFLAAMFATQVVPAITHGPSELTRAFSWVFAFALVLAGAPVVAIVALGFSSFVGALLSDRDHLEAIFDSGRHVASVATGALLFHQSDVSNDLVNGASISGEWLRIAFTATAATILLNSLAVGVMAFVQLRRGMIDTIASAVRDTFVVEAVFLTLAPISVVVAQRSVWLIPLALVNILTVHRMTERATANERDAKHDTLTGLPNRRMFRDEAARRLDAGQTGAVVIVDLDGFKRINDHLGHQIGDQVLRVAASRFQDELRPEDMVARLGGDEFGILLDGDIDADQAERVLTDVMVHLRKPIEIDGAALEVGASFGVALVPEHGDELEELLERADAAMYNAKKTRVGVCTFDPRRDYEKRGRLSLLAELRDAIESDELVVHYQPWVNTSTRTVEGIESLVRWPHRKRGLLMPGEFVPLVQDPEIASALNRLVIKKTITQCAAWHQLGYKVPVAINLVPLALDDTSLPDFVAELLRRHKLPIGSIEIELDDRLVSTSQLADTMVLDDLRQLGATITLDDFGTGTGSLAHLRAAAIDTLKLDRALVRSATSDPKARAIVRSLISLAAELDMRLVAKGIEHLDTVDIFEQLGCPLVQGYLIAKPQTAGRLLEWLPTSQFGFAATSVSTAVGAEQAS